MSDDLDRRLRESLSDLPLPAAPRELHDAMDRLEAEPRVRSRPRVRGILQAAPVLAVAIAMVAFIAWGSGFRLGASPYATPSESTKATPGQSPATSPPPSAGFATENPKPAGSIVPWLDQTAFTAPSPTPVAIPSGTPTCLPSDLTASAGWQGATGSMVGGLEVTNVGQHACVLDGSPRLVQLRFNSKVFEAITYRGEASDGSSDPSVIAGPVLLEPGGAAGAFLSWSNWCPGMIPVVTSLLVTLPAGGAPIDAGPTSPGPGIGGVPRCDAPSAGSTLTAYAFTPVAPSESPSVSQPASVALSVPSSASAGADLVYYVTLTNLGSQVASLNPCPTYSENLIVDGGAVKLPTTQFLLLNCAAIGPALAPGASVTLEMHLPVPASAVPGPAKLYWSMDPGGPLDTSSASPRVVLTIVGPLPAGESLQPTATDTPSPTVLLTFEASGSKSSKPFTASGDSVELAYTFDCSGLGSSGKFDATFYDRNGVAATDVGGRGRSGKDMSTVYISNTAPPYHVEANSDCSWAITVTGMP